MNLYSDEQTEKFESIFVSQNVDDNYGIAKKLDDDEYIEYLVWFDANFEDLYKRFLPNTMLLRGNNPNIIFHGGCLGCLSQRLYGIDRCKGCKYFKFTNKPNLFIEGEESAKISGI